MEIRSFGDRKNFTSLALLCELFGVATPKDDIDGSQVSEVYRKEQDLTRIVSYCEKDVVATAHVYHKLMGLPIKDRIIKEK
jgi:predicted PolB exonuclease-like 3'-5' exonuclease